jgi:hypothetical protein
VGENWDDKRLSGEVDEHVFWTEEEFQGPEDPEWEELKAKIHAQVDHMMKKAFKSAGVVRLRGARKNC